ncbi:DUF3389 domain-containing protein [Vibrio sp.]|uniref:DUF3389 domain-containing protein n=1 Tax=Vibrio sp. TaxID=678 RepID=UPI003D0E3A3E
MVIEFSSGKIVLTRQEINIRLSGVAMSVLQAQIEAIELISGANVVTANSGEVRWSVKLDNAEQLQQLSEHAGIAIR